MVQFGGARLLTSRLTRTFAPPDIANRATTYGSTRNSVGELRLLKGPASASLNSGMARRLLQLSVAFALIVAVGGHWALLQSVAWVSMAVNYSKDAPLEVALQKTFDGRHPCKICIAVKEGKEQEQKRAVVKIETKLDLLCLKQFAYFPPDLPFTLLSSVSEFALARSQAPPLPPPRFA